MRQTSLPPYLDDVATPNDSEDINDIIMSSDGESPAYYPLPPRIAARLNRYTARKSSNSSRRNSVSSLHSNRSNRSCHGRPHNTHIAQHLRRASILESRKARLADRAAYAEKVRLRAQEAKAAPRTSRGEDRALAAQQARERYLAQVAAGCAEEVKKSMKIAEEHRERKAAENLKLREEMAERLADAERRRLAYQQSSRRNRAASVPATDGEKISIQTLKPRDETSAVKTIQKAWRSHQRKKILSEFLELGLDLAHVQKLSFEEVMKLLALDKVIERTGRVMRLCGLQDVVEGPGADTTVVRVFLSTYLILGHPRYVLSHRGDREEFLMEKAKVLLMQFQRVLSLPPTSASFSHSSEPLLSLSEAFSDFQLAFTAWKNHDSSTVIDTMLAQFAELDAIWQTVKNDTAGGAAGDYREGIRYNQTLLLARLKRLAGPEKAIKLVNEAIKARRRSKGVRKSSEDIRPRGAASASSTSATLGESSNQVGHRTEGANSIQNEPPTSQLNKVLSPLPGNRIIVHELAINKDFRIDVDTASETRQTVNRAVFNAMREDMLKRMGDRWVLSMAGTIREKLLRVMPPGKSLHVQISEGLDLKIVQKQLELGNFSYDKFFSFMNSLLPKLVSPARDPLVKDLAADHSDDYVNRLAKLMHIIDLLSLDYSNYLLMSTAPELLKHATSYEQQCFEKALGNRGLSKALRWWKLARQKTISDLSRRSSEEAVALPTSQKIYITGFVDIFIAIPTGEVDVPETLELDTSRIKRVRSEVLRMITISSIILTAKNLLKRDVRTQWRTQAQRMWDLPEATAFTDTTPYLSILESSTALPPSTRTSLMGTIERVLSDARASPNISHPVMKVLLQKLKAHILARLAATSSEERVRLAASTSEVLSSGGLAEFVGRISGIVDEMAKVKQVDWDAHGKWLDEVARRVERESVVVP